MITKRNLRMWKMVFVLVVGIGCTTAGGAVRYVNDDASGTGTGLNWGDAYNHLQDALADACSNPDVNQIWVAEGTYKPDQNSAEPNGTGDRTATFQLINGVAIYGGFIGYETSPGERFWPLAETILSGDLDSNDMDVGEPCDLLNEPTRAENSYHVVTGSDTEPNAILDGFIIRAGNANEPSGPNAYGGGMYNDYGSPTVANCTFRENSSGMYGGGMHNEVGNPAVVNCTFSENSAGQHGGGMYNTSPRPTVTNCIFNRNWAAAFGGGFCNVLGHPDLANCTFSGNMAASGGGMYNLSSEPNMVNCTFSRNFATITGGVESDSGSDPTMINCVLWGNRDGTGSGEMAQIGGPASATIAYCCIQGYGQGGVGNINEPPQFVDANGPDGEAGTEDDNLRLGPNSPCIDEGNDLELPGDVTTDLDGRARIADGDCNFVNGISVDMGAYEFAWVYIGDFDMECDVDLADWALFAMAWLKEEGEAGYISDYDISIPADDKIDWRDVKIFCDNWLAGSVTNIDDDLAGYTVSAISGDTTETGGTATFTVVLNSEPTDNVTVNFDTSDLTEGTVSITSLTFTTGDWDTPQTVTVTGQDDPVQDGDQPYTIVFSPSLSVDPVYNGTTPSPDVAVTNLDDDIAGYTVSAISGDTTETGGTATFTVVLNSEPTDNVTVNFDTSDLSEGTVSITSLTFTTGDWDTPQTVTVTGQDDPVQDGDQPYTIVFSPSLSVDPVYNGTTPAPNVAVTNVEAGTDGTIDIIQGSFTPGWAILVRVLLDTDEYANATSGAGNDAITVTVSSNITGDSETITLRESTTTAGDFDCTIEGCIVNTQDSGTPVAADSLLQVTAGEVVTVTYIDAVRSDGSLSFPVSATITAGPSSCVRITINEVVTEGVIDWSDSSGGDGIKFNNIPGTDPGNHHDEWFEFYNSGTCAVDLTGYKLRIIDGSDYLFEWNITPSQEKQTLVFLSDGSSTNFLIGEYHILGQPSGNAEDETGKTSDDVWLRLEGPDGSILDEVAIGTSVGGDGDNTNNAPPGPAAGPNDESARRCPNLTDTNVDNADWFRSTAGATIVGANPGAPCP